MAIATRSSCWPLLATALWLLCAATVALGSSAPLASRSGAELAASVALDLALDSSNETVLALVAPVLARISEAAAATVADSGNDVFPDLLQLQIDNKADRDYVLVLFFVEDEQVGRAVTSTPIASRVVNMTPQVKRLTFVLSNEFNLRYTIFMPGVQTTSGPQRAPTDTVHSLGRSPDQKFWQFYDRGRSSRSHPGVYYVELKIEGVIADHGDVYLEANEFPIVARKTVLAGFNDVAFAIKPVIRLVWFPAGTEKKEYSDLAAWDVSRSTEFKLNAQFLTISAQWDADSGQVVFKGA